MKKIYMILPVLLLLLGSFPALTGCKTTSLDYFEETRDMMDTFIRVVVYAEEEKGREALNAAFSRIEEINRIATSWDSEGEAYKLNEEGYLDNPSEELVDMLEYAIEYNGITDGYFDITVQPLLDLWSYDPEAEQQFWELDAAAQQDTIDETMKLVGSDRIVIEDGTVRLLEGTVITLGGIAKGYAGDEALKTLKQMGIGHAMIDAGGDIKTLGAKPDGEQWNITLVNPDDTTQYLADFYVSDMAVTTSGNYERYYDPDKTVHHILNPKTGFSANECISVTIVAETGIQADTLSTGVFAMGPEKGLELVESLNNTEVLIVDSERNIIMSSGLSKYLGQE